MSSISQCENDINRYRNLKTKLNLITNKLSLAINNVTDFDSEINNKILINDDISCVGNDTRQLKQQIESTLSYIKNRVIPEIDNAIYNLNNQIDKLEEEQIKEQQMKNEQVVPEQKKESEEEKNLIQEPNKRFKLIDLGR